MSAVLKLQDQARPTGRIKLRTTDARTGVILSETPWMENLVMDSDQYGLNLIARSLIGDTTYGAEITHGKIGTSATAVADSQTDLVAPTNLVSTGTPSIARGDQSVNSVDVVHVEFFITDADLPNGTYREWGIFFGAYGVNERMFARALITPVHTKATGQNTTVIHEVTLTN